MNTPCYERGPLELKQYRCGDHVVWTRTLVFPGALVMWPLGSATRRGARARIETAPYRPVQIGSNPGKIAVGCGNERRRIIAVSLRGAESGLSSHG